MSVPHPVAVQQIDDPELVDRDLDCRHYDDCLDRAVREGWKGFACSECEIRGKAQVGELRALAFTLGGRATVAEVDPRRGPNALPLGEVRGRILAALGSQPDRVWTIEEVVATTEFARERARNTLGHLAKEGVLERVGRGSYRLRRIRGAA